MAENFTGARAQQRGAAGERGQAHEFFPDDALNIVDQCHIKRAAFRAPFAEFAHHRVALGPVSHHAVKAARASNDAGTVNDRRHVNHAAAHLGLRQFLRNHGHTVNAVLQGQHPRVFRHQRAHGLRRRGGVIEFDRKHHQVGDADGGRVRGGLDLRQQQVFVRHLNA